MPDEVIMAILTTDGCKSSASWLQVHHHVVGTGMPDVERLTRKLERRKTTLADLCQLYRASSKLPMIEQALLAYEGPFADLLKTR